MTKARGRIRDFYPNQAKGEAFLSLSLTDYQAQEIADLQDKDLALEVKVYRKPRSLDANAACWFICSEIAKVTGLDKEDIYRENIRQGNEYTPLIMLEEAVEPFRRMWSEGRIGWFVDEVDYADDGQMIVFAYHGSSQYDTKQMSQLIDRLLQDADNVGIHIDLNQERIDSLMADWEAKRAKHTARKG